MDKTIAGLLGAAALTAVTGANATSAAVTAPTDALQASSYADLLAPVPNALSQLIVDDTARAGKSSGLEMAQVQVEIGGRHHHHHHHRYRRHRHHHHHHHGFMAIPRAAV
jgi:hypothetical protein